MAVTYRRTSATMSADVGEDVVALHAERGFAYGMEQVSADVWKLLEQPTDLEAIVARLTAEYDVDEERCRAEVTELLDQMTAEGLVEEVQ